MHTIGLPKVVGKLRFIPPEIGFDSLRFIQPSSLEEPIQALDGSAKVGRQKLPFPRHPQDHG
jgi:hypothetical protein